MSDSLPTRKIDSIQVIRAFAAITVFFYHMFGSYFDFKGAFGVDIFFCISGFLVMLTTQTDANAFLRKRVARIVPLYWIVSLGFFAMIKLAHAVFAYQLGDAVAGLDRQAVLNSLLFLPVGSLYPNILLVPGWTLHYEMVFYLLFWVACLCSIRYRAIICSTLVVALYIISDVFHLLEYDGLIFFEFLWGFVLFYLLKALWKPEPGVSGTNGRTFIPSAWKPLWEPTTGAPGVQKTRLLCSTVSLVAALSLYLVDFPIHRLFTWEPLGFALIVSFMTATHGLKLPKALVALGDMSFSVYLIHSPVLYVVKGMLVHFAGADVRLNDRGGKILTDPPLVAAYFTASLAVTLLLSHFSYAFIERKLSGLLLGKLVSSAHAAPRNQ